MEFEPETKWLLDNAGVPFNICWEALGAQTRPVYVDLGAAHPENKSLTSVFRMCGWCGLAVDANPDYAKDWADAGFSHHFVCALLSDQPTARFVTHENSFTSRISDSEATDHPEHWGITKIEERITVPLNALLEMHGIEKIDLLTVDLEGHEAKVLKTLDWEKHQPAWVIVEYVTAGIGVNVEILNLMIVEKGYTAVYATDSNMIFKRK